MTTNQEGRILSLHICVGHFEPMKDADSMDVLTGFGIEGDRHAYVTSGGSLKVGDPVKPV